MSRTRCCESRTGVNQPLVSSVSPCFNQERFTESTTSVRSQTEPRREPIVVDDRSSDESVALATAAAKGDARVCVLQMPHRESAIRVMRGLHTRRRRAAPCSLLAPTPNLTPRLDHFARQLDSDPQLSMVHGLVGCGVLANLRGVFGVGSSPSRSRRSCSARTRTRTRHRELSATTATRESRCGSGRTRRSPRTSNSWSEATTGVRGSGGEVRAT